MNCYLEIQKKFPTLDVRKTQPLREFTTFRLGGSCPLFINNPAAAELPEIIQLLNRAGMPFIIIGQGSNLVISDAGLDCAVIRFCSEVPEMFIAGKQITVAGNTLLDDFVRYTIEKNAGDISYCAGIPGTVGGGIAGNAGAFGRALGDHLISVELLDTAGEIHTVFNSGLEFSYRHSKLKKTAGVILSATFELPPAEREFLISERARILEFRRTHHPDWRTTPCAGSVFRNVEPTSGLSADGRRKAAGWFLAQSGVCGMKTGGAYIYEKHANIIIADSTCTADDVHQLVEKMAGAVKQKFNIELIPEVRFLGKFS
ncbi:MAG: UDP-N-acetylmuramate dehydrogenase [Kiritimatiellales bacterium]